MIVTSNPARALPDIMEKGKDLPFVSISIQTTGLDYKVDNILQIGAIRYRFDNEVNALVEEATFNRYVRYEKPVSKEITAMNGITSDMVKNADKIEVVMRKLAAFCGNSFIAILYNSAFVTGWLKWQHIMTGVPFEPTETIDVYRIVQDVCGSAKESLKLRAVVQNIGVNIPGVSNDAPHDAACIGAVFNHYRPIFLEILPKFPKGTDIPQVINIEKADPEKNEPVWVISCRFYGKIVMDSYTGTFSNEYDCFERLDVNKLEDAVLEFFNKSSLRDIK